MLTWLPLPNLPQVPQHFVDQLRNTEPEQRSDSINSFADLDAKKKFSERKLLVAGQEKPTRIYYGYKLGAEWEQWVRENITTKFWQAAGRVSYPVSDMHGAHVDKVMTDPPSIKWKINYFTDLGGQDVVTTFYREHGQPIERTAQMPQAIDDYSRLEVLEQVIFPANTWVVLNTSIMHGVENLGDSPRRYFTIMVDREDVGFDLLRK